MTRTVVIDASVVVAAAVKWLIRIVVLLVAFDGADNDVAAQNGIFFQLAPEQIVF